MKFYRNAQSVVPQCASSLISDDSQQIEMPSAQPRSPELPVDVSDCSGFQDLPDEILEQIFVRFIGSSRKNHFAVCGVSRAWRRLGLKIFFSSPWDTPHLICHPNQLFCLSPRTPSGSRSGLLKCFVRREFTSPCATTPARRTTFHLGKDPTNLAKARFLFCAVRRNRHETLIYLDAKCEGPPCAVLSSNFLCTAYSLTLDDGMSCLLTQPAAAAAAAAAALNCNNNSINYYNAVNGGGVSSAAAAADESEIQVDGGGTTRGVDEFGEISSCAGDGAPSISGTSINGGDGAGGTTTTTTTTGMPQLLLSLRYRARIKGLMQPRRMDVALPNPDFMAAHRALPRLTDLVGNCEGATTTTTNASCSHGARRMLLSNVSSVVALESPSPPPPSMGVMHLNTFNHPSTSSSSSTSMSVSAVTTPDAPELLHASAPVASPSSQLLPPPLLPAAPPLPTIVDAERERESAFWRRALRINKSTTTTNTNTTTNNSMVLRRRRPAGIAPGTRVSSLMRMSRGGATFDESVLPVCLRNKAPHWNEALRCWCLNFRGRVKLASVKNSQLVKDNDDEEGRVVMQFGKVDKDAFILDFNPTVLSAVQAFSVALTTFDSKMTL